MILRWRLREPFCGWSHLCGGVLSLVGLLALVSLSIHKPWHLIGFLIYGLSLLILYIASTLYHSLPATPQRLHRLLIFDQVAIYLLIAGTYTPLCLVSLRGFWGWSLLAVVWGIALAGSAIRITWRGAPPWLPIVLYLLMGWLSLLVLPPLQQVLPAAALQWLFAGGMLYTVGTVVFALKIPQLWPGTFSSHELWHLFVLAGSGCHYVLMLRFVAPAP